MKRFGFTIKKALACSLLVAFIFSNIAVHITSLAAGETSDSNGWGNTTGSSYRYDGISPEGLSSFQMFGGGRQMNTIPIDISQPFKMEFKTAYAAGGGNWLAFILSDTAEEAAAAEWNTATRFTYIQNAEAGLFQTIKGFPAVTQYELPDYESIQSIEMYIGTGDADTSYFKINGQTISGADLTLLRSSFTDTTAYLSLQSFGACYVQVGDIVSVPLPVSTDANGWANKTGTEFRYDGISPEGLSSFQMMPGGRQRDYQAIDLTKPFKVEYKTAYAAGAGDWLAFILADSESEMPTITWDAADNRFVFIQNAESGKYQTIKGFGAVNESNLPSYTDVQSIEIYIGAGGDDASYFKINGTASSTALTLTRSSFADTTAYLCLQSFGSCYVQIKAVSTVEPPVDPDPEEPEPEPEQPSDIDANGWGNVTGTEYRYDGIDATGNSTFQIMPGGRQHDYVAIDITKPFKIEFTSQYAPNEGNWLGFMLVDKASEINGVEWNTSSNKFVYLQNTQSGLFQTLKGFEQALEYTLPTFSGTQSLEIYIGTGGDDASYFKLNGKSIGGINLTLNRSNFTDNDAYLCLQAFSSCFVTISGVKAVVEPTGPDVLPDYDTNGWNTGKKNNNGLIQYNFDEPYSQFTLGNNGSTANDKAVDLTKPFYIEYDFTSTGWVAFSLAKNLSDVTSSSFSWDSKSNVVAILQNTSSGMLQTPVGFDVFVEKTVKDMYKNNNSQVLEVYIGTGSGDDKSYIKLNGKALPDVTLTATRKDFSDNKAYLGVFAFASVSIKMGGMNAPKVIGPLDMVFDYSVNKDLTLQTANLSSDSATLSLISNGSKTALNAGTDYQMSGTDLILSTAYLKSLPIDNPIYTFQLSDSNGSTNFKVVIKATPSPVLTSGKQRGRS